jgi:hypothetical protein
LSAGDRCRRPGQLTKRVKLLLLAALLFGSSVQSSLAGISAFIDGCMANAADFSRLAASLKSAGMTEIDPGQGPQFPFPTPERRRLWKSVPAAGASEEAFTGYVAGGGDTQVEICWHVSRPGESAAIALHDLKRRYPPSSGKTSEGTVFFHGGSERWDSLVDGNVLTIGVNWPLKNDPSSGTSVLYVLKRN